MIVAIHQPNFLPWLGYFYKLASTDAFVFLDNVQYSKNSFINRNRIKTPIGPQWLTVPVQTSGKFNQKINEVVILPDADWKRRHLNTLRTNYGRAPFFEEVFAMLNEEYALVERGTKLADFNVNLVLAICSYLGIESRKIRASEMLVDGTSTGLLVSICQELGAS